MQRARFLSADFGRSALVLQLSAAILTAIFFAGITAESAHANPADGVVAAGSATISESGKKLDVHQASDRAVIDWRSFNIEVDEHTQFHQPSASAVAVNRVNSNDPSQIMGRLSANGNVVLINPNGVFFGRDSQVDVNGLIATSADIDNNQVMQGGKLHFTKPGKPTATITNQGTITAKQAGLVGLVAPNVENDGVIAARLGKVQLASGDQMTVDLYGDGLMELAVSDTVEAQLVKNTGTISAEGGTIALTAAAGRQIVNSLVQIEGELTAPTVAEHNGKIIIAAEGGNATILAGGQIKASGEAADTTGGTVRLEADKIAVTGKIDASGKAGGGKVFVGGDYLGGKPGAKKYADTPIKNAKAVVVTDNASIDVSAKDRGNGGTAIVWSDDYTNFAGTIYARGGAMGGDGGFVETSSKDNLQSSGLVDAAAMAPGYQAGTWLLDPRNLTISSSSTTNGAFDNGSPNIFTPTGDSATVLNTTINSALDNGTTVILNTGSTGTQAGDITIGADISKTSGGDAGLILRAAGSILNSGTTSISSTLGRLHVKLNSDSDNSGGGAIALSNMSITTNGGNLSMGGGNLASQQAINAAYSQADYDNASVALLDTAKGLSGRATGINLTTSSGTSTYNTGAGSLSLLGKGLNSGVGSRGVAINTNTIVQTDSGALNVTGTGGNGAFANYGVIVGGTNALITSLNGAVTVEGVGGNGTGVHNYGTYLVNGGQITSTGSATLNIKGTGGNGTNYNYGVYVNGTNALITTLNGAVTVEGVGGNGSGSSNSGTILYNGGQITSTGSATLNIKGTGGGTGASINNHGIELHTTTSIFSSTGSILLYGTKGVNSSFGITTAGTNTLGSATQTGNIELYSDSWGTPSASTSIITQGQVIFAPLTAGNSIGLNGGAGTVSIPNSWIAAINTVAPSKLVLGRSTDGSGAVTIGSGWDLSSAATFPSFAGYTTPVEIYGGSITTGNITAGSKSLLLQTRTGDITLNSGTVLSSSASGNAITLAAAGNFVNNAGSGALSTPNGRWLVYSTSAAANTLGGLTAPQTINGQSYASLPPSSITTPTYSATQNSFIYSASAGGTGGILRFTANSLNRFYGDTNPALTYSFWCSTGCTESAAVTGLPTLSTTAVQGSDVGTYAISIAQGGLTLTSGFAGSTFEFIDGLLTLNPRVLTAALTGSVSKTYDRTTAATLAAGNYSLSNIYGSDDVTLNNPTGTYDTANVGTGKTVSVTGLALSGAKAGNYTLAATSVSGGIGSITAKALTIAGLSGVDKVYDGTSSASLSGVGSLSGVVAGDSVTLGGSATTASFANANVGTAKAITVAGYSLGGADSGNYSLSQPSGLTANITARALSITANNKTMTYGDGNSFNGYSSSGLVAGDSISAVDLATNASLSSAGQWNAGNWLISAANATGSGLSNYSIAYNTGTLSVGQKALSIAGLSGSNKVYDRTTTASLSGSANLSGLVTGDSVSLDGTASTASFANANVGTAKAITVAGYSLGGADSGNYSLSQPSGLTANITARALSITANNKTMTYGDGNSFNGYSSSGLVAGDSISAVDLATNASLSGAGQWNAGNWLISAANATGSGLSNYSIAYNTGTLSVGKRTLNGSINNKNLLYGDATPNYSKNDITWNAGDFYGSDSVANLTSATIDLGGYVQGSRVGTYNLTLASVDLGSLFSNYQLGSVMSGILTVTNPNTGGDLLPRPPVPNTVEWVTPNAAAKPTESKTDTNTDSHAGTTDKMPDRQADPAKSFEQKIPMLLIDPALARRLGLQAQLFEQLTMPIRKTLPINKWFEKSSQISIASVG